jgi:hypothetical protein
MTDHDDDKALAELDKAFDLMTRDPLSQALYEERKVKDEQWKRTDPDGYKKDMEKMCRNMFGDGWRTEYDAMLREEFPEDCGNS